MTEIENRGFVMVLRRNDDTQSRFPLEQEDAIFAASDGLRGAFYDATDVYGCRRRIKVAEIAEIAVFYPHAAEAFYNDRIERRQEDARNGLD